MIRKLIIIDTTGKPECLDNDLPNAKR